MNINKNNQRPYVDEIFNTLIKKHQIPTKILFKEMVDKFATKHYPSSQIICKRIESIPPFFPQFKGRRSVKNEVWFERLYVQNDETLKAWLETRPSGSWLYVEKSFSDQEIESVISKPVADLLSGSDIPNHIIVINAEKQNLSDYYCTKFQITMPNMELLAEIEELPEQFYPDEPQLSDEEGNTYSNLELFLSFTHVETSPWECNRFYWKREGIRIALCEVAEITVEYHRTPGVSRLLPVIAIRVPYDPEKVYAIGTAPKTFFEKKAGAWMIPLPVDPILAGRILSIYSVLIFPDGRFFRSKL